MEFRIADTFTDSLARLTGDEQKAVKTTAFDLQLNPANPGMSFHKLDKAKDKNFWSVRVSSDIRLIVHKSDASLLLCYVDHHDKAYDWAERRKLETHPKTGAAQLVEIRETVKEIVVPVYVQTELAAAPKPAAEKKPIFAETVRRRTARLWRARRVARRCQEGDRGHAAGLGRPPARRGGGGAAGTGDRWQAARAAARRGGGESLRSSRRPAPLPRDDERRGVAARPRFPVGEVDGLPAPRAAAMGGARLRRPGARLRLGGHGQDHRGAAPGRPSGAHASRRPRPADDLLRHAGECAAHQAEAAGGQRAASRGADRRSLAQRHRPAALQGARRAGDDCQPRGRARTGARGRELPWAATSSACISCSPNGSRWWMPGSWRAGRRIAMSRASAERRGCRRRSARCCGPSSSAFVPG